MVQQAAAHVRLLVLQGKTYSDALDHASFRFGVPRHEIRAELQRQRNEREQIIEASRTIYA